MPGRCKLAGEGGPDARTASALGCCVLCLAWFVAPVCPLSKAPVSGRSESDSDSWTATERDAESDLDSQPAQRAVRVRF